MRNMLVTAALLVASSCTTGPSQVSPTALPSAPSSAEPTSPTSGWATGAQVPRDAIVVSIDGELAAVRPDGDGATVVLTNLTAERLGAFEPAWSPGGERLAFVVGRPHHVHAYAGDGSIYVMDADGSSLHRLTRRADSSQPAWSPDGMRIVFVRDQGQQLVVMRADGSHQHVIVEAAHYYQAPSWSPDGHWIAYQSNHPANTEYLSVFAVHPNGTGVREINDGGKPAWSTDGRLAIAFTTGAAGLWIGRPDGSLRRITRCHLPCTDDLDPSWAPNGRRIAFIRQYGNRFSLAVVDLATGKVTDPLQRRSKEIGDSPAWRP
jgi:Tol biopolymer transport system component